MAEQALRFIQVGELVKDISEGTLPADDTLAGRSLSLHAEDETVTALSFAEGGRLAWEVTAGPGAGDMGEETCRITRPREDVAVVDVFDHASDKPVRQSFVPRGTALSAPPYMLATLALMTSLLAVWRRGRTPVAAAMITYGALSLMGSLSEQIVRRVLRRRSFDPVLAAFILAVAGTSLLIVVFGSAELVGYRRHLRQAARQG